MKLVELLKRLFPKSYVAPEIEERILRAMRYSPSWTVEAVARLAETTPQNVKKVMRRHRNSIQKVGQAVEWDGRAVPVFKFRTVRS